MNDYGSFVKRFRTREVLNHLGLVELDDLLGTLKDLNEFQAFYGECARLDEPMDSPFINRNLLVSKQIWQQHFQRLSRPSPSLS